MTHNHTDDKAVKQQAITWTNIGQHLCRHMVSLDQWDVASLEICAWFLLFRGWIMANLTHILQDYFTGTITPVPGK